MEPAFTGSRNTVPSDVPTPSFSGYVAGSPAPDVELAPAYESGYVPRRRSRPPVLEIIVIVLLVLGAGAAIWMMRSSIPAKQTASVANVEVTITPSDARLKPGDTLDFSATVSGTDDAEVTWSLQEGDAGGQIALRGAKAEAGSVASLATYTAPAQPGTYHLVATSKADPQKSSAAEITVAKPQSKAPSRSKKKAPSHP